MAMGRLMGRRGVERARCRGQGTALMIDCEGCHGDAVPSSVPCLLCAAESLDGRHGAESVVMRRGVDRALRGDAVLVLKELSLVLAVFEGLEGPRRRHCQGCPSSPQEVLRRARAAFPELPPEPTPPEKSRRRCARCITDVSAAYERARGLHRSAAERARTLAFGATG